MRIAVDLRSLIEPLPSGITEYTKQILRQFAVYADGEEFVMFTNSQKPLPNDIRGLWPDDKVVWKHGRWPNKIFNGSMYLTGRPRLDSVVGGADVFFMPNLNFGSFTSGCKVVVTVHDLSFFRHGFYNFKGALWHHMIRPKSLLKRAQAIIAVSKSTAIDLSDLMPEIKNRITVIYSGVDEKYFNDDRQDLSALKAKYRIPNSYILFIGTAENRKNVDSLVRAWQQARRQFKQPVSLVIAGKPLKISAINDPDIHMLGYVPENYKISLYKHAVAFCYPSFFEGFGFPILEAMACGTPVITSHSTSMTEVTGMAGLTVNPYSVEELSRAMISIVNDQKYREILISDGKEQARLFNWRETGRKTLDLLTSI